MTVLQDSTARHTIVVGAGPAGLAVGACLKQAGISCLILEQADKVGMAWHRHYERLHLHTDKKHSELNAFLEGALNAYDDHGTPLFSGPEAPVPGLYFCGFHVSPAGMLREIAIEARRISAAIAQSAQSA